MAITHKQVGLEVLKVSHKSFFATRSLQPAGY